MPLRLLVEHLASKCQSNHSIKALLKTNTARLSLLSSIGPSDHISAVSTEWILAHYWTISSGSQVFDSGGYKLITSKSLEVF